MVLCHVDDLISISSTHMVTIDVIWTVLNFKRKNSEFPEIYIFAGVEKFVTT